MMNMILKKHRAAKKNRKKGFTLIEVIVVIVIIAILAAIAVPSLTRYIGNAEDRAIQATAHNIQVVLQAEKSNQYNLVFPPGDGKTPLGVGSDPAITYIGILSQAGVTITAPEVLKNITWNGQTLATFTYTSGNKYIKYDINTGGFGNVGEGDGTQAQTQ